MGPIHMLPFIEHPFFASDWVLSVIISKPCNNILKWVIFPFRYEEV